MTIRGQVVDIPNQNIFPGEVTVENGMITRIIQVASADPHFIIPGFVDAHIHVESSMLVPSEFARMAVVHGTVATISDPHEIANVLGIDGVTYMIDNAKKVPFKCHFGAPSCVPATSFETAGADIGPDGIRTLMAMSDIHYLAEMMNYPGVLFDDNMVMEKIRIAQESGKPIDGHAPGLRGDALQKYISAGITTDHECFTFDEALEKLQRGMKVLIREGSAAKNFDALAPLLHDHWENMMFCSDDKHPDDLALGHINQLCARAVALGVGVFKVLQVACLNPIAHYNINVGQLREGDPADFIVVDDLTNFKVLQTYINGNHVASRGESLIASVPFDVPNKFDCSPKSPLDFRIPAATSVRVIEALDGQLITQEIHMEAKVEHDASVCDVDRDLLKIAVVNRYRDAAPAVAFIRNFNLKRGAIAGSVAHDCHNIVAVGTSDEEICRAVNLIIGNKGGICAVDGPSEKILPLPVAGIISQLDGWETGKRYQEIDAMAKSMGSTLKAPFMTLSFMALLVIPDLKLSDLGLFSGKDFEFRSVAL